MKFKSSIHFDFLGTIIKKDWDNFILFIEGVLLEIEERKKFLNKEIELLNIFSSKLDLSEKNQFNENTGDTDIGGINDEPPDETSTEHFNDSNKGSGGQAPLEEAININPLYRDDCDSGFLIETIKNTFIDQIKYRRSNLSYKIFKILDLVEQYNTELVELDKKKNDWEKVKQEIERRYTVNEFWELRENYDAFNHPFVNIEDKNKGPSA